MAVVENIAESKQTPSAQHGVILYCCKPEKTQLNEKTMLVSSINCAADVRLAEKSFLATQELNDCGAGDIRFYHSIQSFKKDDDLSPVVAHKIGIEFAKQMFPEHEIIVATHLDGGQLHNHFVINAYNFKGGNKIHMNKFLLGEMRACSDELCKKYGLNCLPKYNPSDKSQNLRPREYRAALKGESWKFELMGAINSAMNVSGSKEDFIREMNRHNYKVIWNDNRKYITYILDEKRKCRDIRLHDSKYLKEIMEYEFKLRNELRRTDKDQYEISGNTQGNTVSADSNGYPEGRLEFYADGHTGSGKLSADTVHSDFVSRDMEEPGGQNTAGNGDRGELYGQDGQQADRSERPDGDGFRKENRTGWEDSREQFFELLENSGQQDRENGQAQFKTQEVYADFHDKYEYGDSNTLNNTLSVIGSLSGINNRNDEDPEERRKRIEAEENSENIGALIGLTAGIIINNLDSKEKIESDDEDITLSI